MCRWIAYSGSAIALHTLLIEPETSLIDQSLTSRLSDRPTNGDGFGVGWYGRRPEPGLHRSVRPAWNDENLLDLAYFIESPLFLAHVRATTDTTVQRTNCHPFRHGKWLFVHNGEIRGHRAVRRDLILALEPALVPDVQGSTDSELLFLLALTFGLQDEPLRALETMAGRVEVAARERGIEEPLQMTLGIADGERLYAVRYSSERHSNTLFCSERPEALRALYPDHPSLAQFPEDSRVIVSEPLGDLPGAWIEVPESTAVVVSAGDIETFGFEPRAP